MKPTSRSLKVSIAEKTGDAWELGFLQFCIRVGPCLIGLVGFWSNLRSDKKLLILIFTLFKRHVNPSMVDHSVKIHLDQHNIALCVSWIWKRKSTLKTLIFCGRQGLCLMIFEGFRSNQHELNIISSHFWCFWNATSITVSNFVARRPISRCVHVYWVTIDSLPVRCIHTA